MTVTPETGGRGVTRFATRGEHRLSYEASGPADATPVLGLHDLLADRGQFRPLAEHLPADEFRLIFPDARGHGASAMISGRGYPPRQAAADALAVLDTEEAPAAHVIGIGCGSATALAVALQAPDRVRALVLAEPVLPDYLTQEDGEVGELARQRDEVIREAAQAADRGQTERALDLYLDLRIGQGWRQALPKARLGAIRRAVGNLAPLLTGLTDEPVSRDELSRLDIPMMLLHRANAPAVERGTIEALASLLSRARIAPVAMVEGTALAPDAWLETCAAALREATSVAGS